MKFLGAIKEKLGDHNVEEVDQLILDGLFKNIRKLTLDQKESLEQYVEIKHLSLNGVGLSSLENFPKLPKLKILELRENKLSGEDIGILAESCPILKKLKLGENPIKKLEFFDDMKSTDLECLEIYNCPISNMKGYRDILFHKVRTLELIDRVDRDGHHLDYSDIDSEQSDYESDVEEDKEYEADEGGEDEYDEDFDDQEEDFELSEYNSNKPSDKVVNSDNNLNKESSEEFKLDAENGENQTAEKTLNENNKSLEAVEEEKESNIE